MTDDDRIELDLLKRNADSLGLYINEHRDFDPCRGNGSLYVQHKLRHRSEPRITLLKWASIEQVWQFIGDYRSKQNAQ
jgi:hypothetical protein